MSASTDFRNFPSLFPGTETAKLELTRSVQALNATDDTLTVLDRANIALRNLTTIIERVSRDARAEGRTWQEIGDALGMTRQAAQERFRE